MSKVVWEEKDKGGEEETPRKASTVRSSSDKHDLMMLTMMRRYILQQKIEHIGRMLDKIVPFNTTCVGRRDLDRDFLPMKLRMLASTSTTKVCYGLDSYYFSPSPLFVCFSV